MSLERERLEDLIDADERGQSPPSRRPKSSAFFSSRLRIASVILLLVFIIAGTVAILSPRSNQATQTESDDADQLAQLRSGSRRYSPDTMGHMDVYINKQRHHDSRRRPKRFQFPAARFSRDRSPLRGPFLSFAPWLPMFADRRTRQTIIFVPTGGVYILPPLINFYGKMFSVAELIASGYASLVADGAPMTALPSIAPFFHPTPLLGGGIPRLSRSSGGFVGGIRSEYDSFDIPRRERKLVYIDGSDEQDEDDDRYDDDDDVDDSYERRQSNSDEEYHQRPRPTKRTSTARTTTIEDKIEDIQWAPCPEPLYNATGAECGLLSVPLDYSRPHGTKIQIALARVKHTVSNDQFQGIVLINPDGPGGSGVLAVAVSQYFPPPVRGMFDWIGFDLRGLGMSRPAISCLPDYDADVALSYIPLDQNREDYWLNRSKVYAQACGKNHGKLLEHMTTADVAKDMERIRIALGQEKINYLGNEYGAHIGAVYATLFPTRVRRVILDSNVDPRQIWFERTLEQAVGFDRNIRIWFRWLARYNRVYRLGDTEGEVEYRWKEVLKQLEAHPANGTIGPTEWIDLFVYVAIDQFFWDPLGSIFSQWALKEDISPFFMFLQQAMPLANDNPYAVYLAVTCTDAPWPKDWNYVRTQTWRTYAKGPLITWDNAWAHGPCQYWPAKASTSVEVDGGKVNDILLLGGTLDAVNPFEGNLELRRRFPRARLVSVRDSTSIAVSLKGNACVDEVVAKYLISGELPLRKSGDGPDVICEALPKPIPAALNQTTTDRDRFKYTMNKNRYRHRRPGRRPRPERS